MIASIVFAAVSHFTPAQLLAAREAIERARYVFVIGETAPFEQQCPRSGR